MAAPLFDGPGLITRRIEVPTSEVAWVRYVLEGHDGLAHLHSDGGGSLTLVAPVEREAELDGVIGDLASEIELRRR
ncbi:MAG: hypothetical protein R3B82_15400 [Sandaracinaceae bacterium]